MTRLTLLRAAILISLGTTATHGQNLGPAEARGIAREAYIYGFPLVENYKSLHRQAVAPGPFFRATFNQFAHDSKPATPGTTQTAWPNADTVMSTAWLDLRADPVVLTLPAVEKERYCAVQLVDLQTFNFGYLGTRTTGHDGGEFLIAGPSWQGEKPPGVRDVVRCETQFAHVIIRTQLLGTQDFKKVQEIQSGFQLRTLSGFLGQAVVATEPPPPWPAPRKDMTDGLRLFPYLNFLLDRCQPHSSEKELMARFARLGIGPGLKIDPAAYTPAVREAMAEGLAEVWSKDFPAVMQRVNRGELTAAECFGSRDFLQGDYAKRAVGAKIGLYGNSREETVYAPYFSARDGRPFDASKNRYALRFTKDELPPCEAFWSFTLYDADTHLLFVNPLSRYSIQSSMVESMVRGEDGSLTIYIQKHSPGTKQQANWLPAPDGPFHCIMRLYQPKPEVIAGKWKPPEMTPVK